MNFLIKVNNNKYETKYLRRFLNHVKTIDWKRNPEIYLRVSYGDGWFNEGDYTDKKEFKLAMEAFIEN